MSKHKQVKQILIAIDYSGKCSQCFDSKCCQYITEQIETPRSIRHFDVTLWQISHNNIHVFKDSSG